MSQNQVKKYLITSALPYANGPIHIGHLAGAYLPADTYVRYLRMKGDDVVYICGSDEHGAAITLKAKKEGTTPQGIVDEFHELNKQAFKSFGISFDYYHRTSDPLHHQTAGDFFLELERRGVFIKKTSEQFYDEEFKQFLADRYVTGTCPKCGHEDAYGDQCEKCGSSLNPLDLINPISTLSQKTPILKETSHWYLPMQNDEAWLRTWIETGQLDGKQLHDPKTWRKHVIGQCKSWLDGGLQERAMTRDLDWGVKVPLKNAEGKVLYVWLDAPIGYISATKQWALENGKNWEDYWLNEDTELLHFIGKDNIVFHCIIFPILLKNHGEFILPKNVPANEFLNLEGKKISTSRNWAVWLHEYLEAFPDQQDILRYVLTSIAPETKDSEFTWADFQARNNSELVAIYGNFINRVMVLVHKYFNGTVPEIDKEDEHTAFVKGEIDKYVSGLNQKMEHLQFRDAQNEAMSLARLGNKFLADTEPWKLIKTNEAEVASILNLGLQIAANLSIAFRPFLPNTSTKLAGLLNLNSQQWSDLGKMDLIIAGAQIQTPEHLFGKIEDEAIAMQVEKLKAPAEKTNAIKMKDHIQFDDFQKIDLRVGEIVKAEKVEKSNKLLKLEVNLGFETRTILSGIANYFSPDDLVGKQVQVLCNLPPRKMMGIESNGMILMAENPDGSLQLMSPNQQVENGSTIA